jgi:L-ascorbate metabolism protein UlaG (beta-lactamase superfamily)
VTWKPLARHRLRGDAHDVLAHEAQSLVIALRNTLWGGFMVEYGSARVYRSGDTAYFAGFSEIGRRFTAIDAALLPIGAYEPAWFR